MSINKPISVNLATLEETNEVRPERIEDLREEKRPDFRGREKNTKRVETHMNTREDNITIIIEPIILKASSSVYWQKQN